MMRIAKSTRPANTRITRKAAPNAPGPLTFAPTWNGHALATVAILDEDRETICYADQERALIVARQVGGMVLVPVYSDTWQWDTDSFVCL